jgi:hypothetical protein
MSGCVSWLLLLYGLPAERNTERVAAWRRFKRIGALQLKTSAYLLPDQPPQYEHFQWIAKQIKDAGGDATLIRAHEIEGVSNEQLIARFQQTCETEYAVLAKIVRDLTRQRGKAARDFPDKLERLTKQFREIREIDFFESEQGRQLDHLLQRAAENPRASAAVTKADPKAYVGRTWVTRPRPEIDRVGSAWLIRHFIDSKAKFVFAATPSKIKNAVSFDMIDGDFTHEGDDCTFETLLKRFSIQDKAVRKIGEMIHDADLQDEKFARTEALGIDRVLKGWAKQGLSDAELLNQGLQCFDGLYAFLRRI